MAIYANRSVFIRNQRTPTVNLDSIIDNGEILVFDSTLGAFKNSSIEHAINLTNKGTGSAIAQLSENNLSFKTIKPGNNILFQDDGNTITIGNKNAAIYENLTELNAVTGDLGSLAYVKDAGGGQTGFYVWNGSGWIALISGASQIALVHKKIDYLSLAVTDIVSLPGKAVIMNTEINISTPFNNGSTFTIGTPDNNLLLLDSNEVDIASVHSFKDDSNFVLPDTGTQNIKAYFNNMGSTQGELTLFIQYSLS